MIKYFILLGILAVAAVLLVFSASSRLGRSVAPENKIPVISAIIKLHAGGYDMVEMTSFKDDVHSTIFLARTKTGHGPIIQYMEERGWEFNDQFGSALSFKKDDKQITLGYRQVITRHYRLIEIPPLE